MSTINDGRRPSHLELDQHATGEITLDDARIDEASRRYLAALEASRAEMPPLELGVIRRKAAALDAPPAANNTRYWLFAPVLVAAAVLLVGLVRGIQPEAPSVRFRGGDGLELFQRSGTELVAYEAGTPLGQSDVLGFKVAATGHRGVVVLSVDGTGAVNVFYPETGESAEPVRGDGFVPLPGTVILDGAPGPEVFVAVFDKTVSEARSEVERTFQAGGHTGLQEWAEASPGVAAVEITRR